MTFFERYEKLAVDRGIKPMSEEAAQKIGVTRSTISIWKKNGSAPMPETVKRIALAYNVSPDYLLGLTDDPTPREDKTETRVPDIPVKMDPLYRLIDKLDDTDRIKAEAYLEGLLAADKYAQKKHA